MLLEPIKSEEQAKEWSYDIVLFTMGDDQSFTYTRNYISRNWNFVATAELYCHDEGYYIVKF